MIYTYLLVIIFFTVAFLGLFTTKRSKEDLYMYVFISIVLTIYAAFRPIGIDRDSEAYIGLFYSNLPVEITFQFITYIANTFFSSESRFLFIIYALIGVGIKLKILKKISPLIILSLLVYLSNLFIQQELTAIRAGASATFILLSLSYLKDRKFLFFLFCVTTATIFHYSAFITILLWLLSPKRISKFYYFIIPIGFIMYILTSRFTVSSQLPILYFQNKIDSYMSSQEQGNQKINVLNALLFIKCALYYFFLYNKKLLKDINIYFPLLIKMYGWSIFIFLSFSFIPVLSFRLSDLFSISEILLIPLIAMMFKNKFIGNSFVVTYSIVIFVYNIFIGRLLIL